MTTPTAPAPLAHHPLGPSLWPAWVECIAFNPMIDDPDEIPVGDEESADDPKTRGTLQHAAAAAILGRSGPDVVSQAMASLEEREREQVQWAVQRVIEICAEHGYGVDDIRVEQRVRLLKPDSFEVWYFGTLDIICGPLVFDLKFGDVRDYFAQLVGYTLPSLEETGGRRIAYVVFARWRRHQMWNISADTARTVGYSILRRRTADVRPPRLCAYCAWCADQATCPAITGTVNHVVERREDWPTAALRLETAHTSLMRADPVMLGKARYLWKAFIEPWGAAVEFATDQLKAHGIAPLGFRIQPKKGAKKIVSGMGAVDALAKAGVPRETIEPLLGVSFGALATAYAQAFGKGQKASETAVEQILLSAGVLAYGEATSTLQREKNALELLAAASAKPVERIE